LSGEHPTGCPGLAAQPNQASSIYSITLFGASFGGMRTQRRRTQIKLDYQRSFRRPVKIRIEAESPRSADRITSLFPAGVLLLANPRPARPQRPQLRVVQVAPEPDWRIVGDQDASTSPAGERSFV
jgi:hypothetical protein